MKYAYLRLKRLLGKPFGYPKQPPSLPEDQFIDLYHPPQPDVFLANPPETLVARHTELIHKIRQNFAYTDHEFESIVLPIIQHYASYIHLLPASKEYHHWTQGGLFHHSLEVASYCLLRSNTIQIKHKFPPVQHEKLKKDLQLGLFICGLWHDSAKPLTDIQVNTTCSNEWRPLISTLYDFLINNEVTSYTITWDQNRKHGKHDDFTSQLVGIFIGKHEIDLHPYVHRQITNHFISKESLFTTIIRHSDRDSTSNDLRKTGTNTFGVSNSAKLLDGVKSLAFDDDGDLSINKGSSPNLVWHSTGMYLRVPNGIQSAYKHLKDNNESQSIPTKTDRMLDVLLEAGFISLNPNPLPNKKPYYYSLTLVSQSHSTFNVEKTDTFVRFKHHSFVIDTLPDPIDAEKLPVVENSDQSSSTRLQKRAHSSNKSNPSEESNNSKPKKPQAIKKTKPDDSPNPVNHQPISNENHPPSFEDIPLDAYTNDNQSVDDLIPDSLIKKSDENPFNKKSASKVADIVNQKNGLASTQKTRDQKSSQSSQPKQPSGTKKQIKFINQSTNQLPKDSPVLMEYLHFLADSYSKSEHPIQFRFNNKSLCVTKNSTPLFINQSSTVITEKDLHSLIQTRLTTGVKIQKEFVFSKNITNFITGEDNGN